MSDEQTEPEQSFGIESDLSLTRRLYRLLDRLLRHLDLLAGEQRDTWWFRSQLGATDGVAKAHLILDKLEAFLVDADSDLARGRDSQLRTLAYSQNQCEELIEQAEFSTARLKALIAQLAGDSGPVEELTDAELDVLRNLKRDIYHAADRLRLVERKLNELHSGVRNRVDIGFKDAVTGVYKKEGFSVRCAELHARWQRAGSPLAALVIRVAPEQGMELSPIAVDDIMRQFALELEARIRVSDVLARTADTEFVLLLPDTSLDGASTFATRMIAAMATVGKDDYGADLTLSLAAGLAGASQGDDAKTFVERAREASIRAAHKGEPVIVA